MTSFPKETFTFLKGIAANNEKAWFESHRDLYEAGYVAPAKAFVEAIGPKLRKLSPEVKFEPKINGSLSRINRDIRFSKDKRPYKDHFDLWFWHGDRKGWDHPGFWLRLTGEGIEFATGMWGMEKPQLETFWESVVHPRSGKALLTAVAEVRARGDYAIGEKTRKRLPKGYEAPEDRADYLLYSGLTAGLKLPAEVAMQPDFADILFTHYANCWPISRWLLAEVAG